MDVFNINTVIISGNQDSVLTFFTGNIIQIYMAYYRWETSVTFFTVFM